MDLRDALSQIQEIRQQMARAETFRGYRSATTAFSALVALGACLVQGLWLDENKWQALYVWLVAAAVSIAVVGSEMFLRYRRSSSVLQREITLANQKKATLKLEELQGNTAKLRVRIPPLDTTYTLGREGSLYIASGPHGGGDLWLVLSAVESARPRRLPMPRAQAR